MREKMRMNTKRHVNKYLCADKLKKRVNKEYEELLLSKL